MEWWRPGHESRGLVRPGVFVPRLTEYTARCLLPLFVLCLSIVVSRAQVQTPAPQAKQSPSQPGDEIKADAVRLYAGARPYMDEPLSELKKIVHEIARLKPALGQEQPSDLLAKIGAKADELLQKVPDLISDESVSQVQYAASQGSTPGCIGTECLATGHGSGFDQGFSYLILTHPAPDGRLVLQEYRTGKKGKPVEGAGAPNFQGFISSWIVFSSPNQLESRFRYLGQQQTDGHNTFVVGFAQIPGSVASPGIILGDRESVPMLFQGIAWIDTRRRANSCCLPGIETVSHRRAGRVRGRHTILYSANSAP
jgi:hypothetical protein